MPAYNARQYIAESIESVQKQTYTNWELLIVDDNSDDNTVEIIQGFAQKDSRIKYFSQNRGRQGKARNKGIENSQGEYIAFLDADDLWDHTKLYLQVNTIEKQPNIDLIFSGGFLLQNGNITEMNVKMQEWSWQKDSDLFISQNQIPILSVLVKKHALINVNSFCEDPQVQNAEDYHLWLKLLKQYSFLSTADRLFYYRLHEQQSTFENKNIDMPVAYGLIDLANSGIIDKDNNTLRTRLKWFVFKAPQLSIYLNQLKSIFEEKIKLISIILVLNKILPNNAFIKRLAFHWL
jgi:teichuronic acid biosynthesis glycosyltransferase TuaG